MARTQSADYDERREAIVEKAAERFATCGFNGSSVADLAKACGMSKSLLYHYYPSKEDILERVMASHIDALIEVVQGVETSAALPARKLEALSRAFLQLYAGAANRQTVLLNELDNLPAEARRKIVGQQRRLVAFVEALIGAIAPRLAADGQRLKAIAMLYFGMINWAHTWYDPKGPITPDALADMASGIFLRGILNESSGQQAGQPS